ncbi:MAG: chromosomal replication initiator protein DnaA [Akkermansia sp.]|nr:chromosomal replication initiator protein DnaA [Akkermansia sp.]
MDELKQERETQWAQIMEDLRTRCQADGYPIEFTTGLSLMEDTGSKLVIEYPQGLMVDWLELNYSEYIENSAKHVLNSPRQLEFVEAREIEASASEEPAPCPAPAKPQSGTTTSSRRPAKSTRSSKIQSSLNENYTFDNYVVGNSNHFAYAAAQALVNSTERVFNPLFIYGKSGLGKTHLLHAIGNALRTRRDNVNVLYVTSEQFTNSYIEAIRKRGDALEVFRRKYRKVDVLLIDDVQFMARADKTQEEFFHTFNALFESGKQIVLSADCPASQITSMDDRLKTRFSQGMTVELTVPCYEMRVAILRQKMRTWKQNLLSDEVVQFLARHITQSVRALEGGLIRTSAFASMNNGCPSIEFLREKLADLMTQRAATPGLSIADIQQRVADEFGLRLADINGRRRTATIAHPRQVAMFLARKHTSCSLQDIGAAFGGRDHGTVLHAMRTIEEKLKVDSSLREAIARVSEALV